MNRSMWKPLAFVAGMAIAFAAFAAQPSLAAPAGPLDGQPAAGPGNAVLSCDDANTADGRHHSTKPTTGAAADTNETYTCTATLSGVAAPNQTVQATVAGANAVTTPLTCTTAINGQCSIVVPGTPDGTHLAAGTGTVCLWTGASGTCDKPVTDDANTTDSTETAQVVWQDRAPSALTVLNEDDSRVLPAQTTAAINVKVSDQFGAGYANAPVDVYVIGGPNHNNGGIVPDSLTCRSAADGTCSIGYSSNGNNGIDRVCAWLDNSPPDLLYEPGGPRAHGGECITAPDSAGASGPALTHRSRMTWSGGTDAAAEIDVTPKHTTGAPVGSPIGLTATVKDENGTVMANQVVDFELTGAGDPDSGASYDTPDRSCTTDQNGTCSLTGDPGAIGSSTSFVSSANGTTTIRAWLNGTQPDTLEGSDATAQPGYTIEPDTTDVATVQWGQLTSSITSFAVSPASHIATWGVKPVVSGTLLDGDGNAISNVTVSIQRAFAGASFSFIGSTQTGDDGSFSFQDTSVPSMNSTYRVVYGGDVSHQGSTSGSIPFWIRAGVIFNVSPTNPAVGRAAALSGYVAPSKPGKRVTLQMLDGAHHQWVNLRTVTLDRNSKYYFTYTRTSSGFLLFRILYATQDSLNVWNSSRNMSVNWS